MTTSRHIRVSLSARQVELLRQLKLDPNARDHELAERMGLKKRYVKVILKSLREENLVYTTTKRRRVTGAECWWNQRTIFVKEP